MSSAPAVAVVVEALSVSEQAGEGRGHVLGADDRRNAAGARAHGARLWPTSCDLCGALPLRREQCRASTHTPDLAALGRRARHGKPEACGKLRNPASLRDQTDKYLAPCRAIGVRCTTSSSCSRQRPCSRPAALPAQTHLRGEVPTSAGPRASPTVAQAPTPLALSTPPCLPQHLPVALATARAAGRAPRSEAANPGAQ